MNTPIQQLLLQIKAETGWSEPRIASEIGTSQPTVNRLINGQQECKASTWMAIEELAARLKRKRRRALGQKPGAQSNKA